MLDLWSLGFLAHTKGVEVGDVVDEGPGLAFVVSKHTVVDKMFRPPTYLRSTFTTIAQVRTQALPTVTYLVNVLRRGPKHFVNHCRYIVLGRI